MAAHFLDDLRDFQQEPAAAKYGNLLYKSEGNGLTRDGYSFDPHVADALPPEHCYNKRSGKLKTGKIVKRELLSISRPLAYWKAQCAFRGLPTVGGVANLQDLLKTTNRGMLKGLQELESRLNTEYTEATNKAWQTTTTDPAWSTLNAEQRIESDSKRFLQENFPLGDPRTNAIVVDIHSRNQATGSLEQVAGHLGLHMIRIDHAQGLLDAPVYTIVIGNIEARVKLIVDSLVKLHAEKHKKQERQAREAKEKVITDQRARVQPGEWDVTGSWKIECPEIKSEYNVDKMTLSIYHKRNGDVSEMFADFDFGILKGVFRLEKPAGPGSKPYSERARFEPKFDEYEEDERRSPTPDCFHLGPNDQPSPQQSTWAYRWRGRESGEEQIQAGADDKECTLTFSGSRGLSLRGTFESDLLRPCIFTGSWVEPPKTCDYNISNVWGEMNYDAWETAGRRRWGGW